MRRVQQWSSYDGEIERSYWIDLDNVQLLVSLSCRYGCSCVVSKRSGVSSLLRSRGSCASVHESVILQGVLMKSVNRARVLLRKRGSSRPESNPMPWSCHVLSIRRLLYKGFTDRQGDYLHRPPSEARRKRSHFCLVVIGQVYYWHTVSREVTWDRPSGAEAYVPSVMPKTEQTLPAAA